MWHIIYCKEEQSLILGIDTLHLILVTNRIRESSNMSLHKRNHYFPTKYFFLPKDTYTNGRNQLLYNTNLLRLLLKWMKNTQY